MRALILVLVVACGASKPSPSPQPAPAPAPIVVKPVAPTDASANAAYDAKDYTSCATQFLAIAAIRKGKRNETARYNAACCQALAGDRDGAFATLAGGVVSTRAELEHFEKDTDLASLHDDPRWASLVTTMTDKVAAAEHVAEPALRAELLALRQEDQAAIKAYVARMDDAALKATADRVNAKTTRRMNEIVAKYGWPSSSLVGEDGANAAWLLVQHADKDLALQKQSLAAMEALLARGEVSEVDWAYLYDRVAVNEGRLQRYGTQFDNDRKPRPMEDPEHVDERRLAIGLDTLAEYTQTMIKNYGAPKK